MKEQIIDPNQEDLKKRLNDLLDLNEHQRKQMQERSIEIEQIQKVLCSHEMRFLRKTDTLTIKCDRCYKSFTMVENVF